jgi:hypothetical protein
VGVYFNEARPTWPDGSGAGGQLHRRAKPHGIMSSLTWLPHASCTPGGYARFRTRLSFVVDTGQFHAILSIVAPHPNRVPSRPKR